MEKLYITEAIATYEANNHLNLEVGKEYEQNSTSGCSAANCAKTQPSQPGEGHWSCVLGECVWVPAP